VESKNQRRRRVYRMRRESPKLFILYRTRRNAKMHGWPCLLKLEDIPDIPEFCPIFPWIRLVYQVGHTRGNKDKSMQWGSPSIDRINNFKGYVRRNVRIISFRANWLKGSASNRELIALGKDGLRIEKLHKKQRSLSS
jgi:hypothetical protein